MRELVKRGVRSIGAATVVAALGLGGCGGGQRAEPAPTGSNRELVEWRAAEGKDQEAEALLNAGKLDEAERAFQQTLGLSDKFALAHQGMAIARFHRGEDELAIDELHVGVALTPPVDSSYSRTRLLEDLAVALFTQGKEQEAFEAIAGSVAAQGLKPATARAVTKVGKARLLLDGERWAEALIELRSAGGEVGAEEYALVTAAALEVVALVGLGELERAKAAQLALVAQVGGDHPRTLEPAFALALARGDLAAAETLHAKLVEMDPYAGERAEMQLAQQLKRAGKTAEARSHFETISRRYLRSAGSAQLRREAERELAGK